MNRKDHIDDAVDRILWGEDVGGMTFGDFLDFLHDGGRIQWGELAALCTKRDDDFLVARERICEIVAGQARHWFTNHIDGELYIDAQMADDKIYARSEADELRDADSRERARDMNDANARYERGRNRD